jgi:hypothetical protein
MAADAANAPTGERGGAQRTIGVVVMGVGLLGAGVGGGIMLMAKAQYDGVSGCNGTVCDNQSAIDTRNAARANGTVASYAMLGGAGLIVGGGLLWLVAPRGPSPSKTGTVEVHFTPGGFAAGGTF